MLDLVDRYTSTLSSSYSSGGTSLSVNSAAGLPSGACYFFVIVRAEGANTEEVFLVTNVSGTTLTVSGAKAGTSASNHASGAAIIGSIITATAAGQLKLDAGGIPGFPGSGSIPDFSAWTLVNSLVLVGQTGGAGYPALFKATANASLNWRMATTAIPSTPYSIIVRLPALQDFRNISALGLHFSDGTKFEGIQLLQLPANTGGTGPFPSVRVQRMNSTTSDNSTVVQFSGPTEGGYFAIAQDASNQYFYYSLDGRNWITILSQATGTFLTPTTIALGAVAVNSTSVDLYFSVIYWRQTANNNCA